MTEFFVKAETVMPGPDIGILMELMRERIDIPGRGWTRSWIMHVWPGCQVRPHKHGGTVAVYYHDIGDPPAPVVIANIEIMPRNGEILIIPPMTEHLVEPSPSRRVRVSFAMQVNETTTDRPQPSVLHYID